MKKPQNIPTWNYPSKGTPIFKNTSEVPPSFKYGGKMYNFGGNLGAGVSGIAQGIAGSLLPGPLGTMAVKGIQGIHSGLDKNMSEQEKGIAGFGRAVGAGASAIATGGASLSTGFDDITSGLATGIGGFNGKGDDQMLNMVGQAAGFVGGGITEGAGSEGGMLGVKGFINKYNPNDSRYKDWQSYKTGLNEDWRNTMKYGGNMYPMGGQMQQGMENQLTEFNEGGSHEMNPQGGIPQGIGANGQPNLVEEGETKLNSKDYVYSDSLKLDKAAVESFNLPSKFVNKTFAEASKLVNRPNSRRENDTIENEAKSRELDALMNAQEDFKAREFEAKMLEAQTMFPEQFATMQGMFAGQGQPQAPEQGVEDPMAQAMGNPMEQQMGIGQEQIMKYGGNLFATGGGLGDPPTTYKGEDPVKKLLDNYPQLREEGFDESTLSIALFNSKAKSETDQYAELMQMVSDQLEVSARTAVGNPNEMQKISALKNQILTDKQAVVQNKGLTPQEWQQMNNLYGTNSWMQTPNNPGNILENDELSENQVVLPSTSTTIEPSVVNTNTPFEIAMSPRMTKLQNAGVNPLAYSDEQRAKMNQAKLDFENGVIDEDTYNDIIATETGEEDFNAGNVSYYTDAEKYAQDPNAFESEAQAEYEGVTPVKDADDNITGWTPYIDSKFDVKGREQINESLGEKVGTLAPIAYNTAMGIATAFQKPMKLSYEDYINNQKITAPKMNVDPQLRASEQAFAAGQKGLKNIGGAAYLKSIGSLANQEAMNRAGIYANKENVDNQAQLQADTFNTQLASQNANSRFQVDDWNARAKTAKSQQMADYFGTAVNQAGQMGQASIGNKLANSYNNLVSDKYGVDYNPYKFKNPFKKG